MHLRRNRTGKNCSSGAEVSIDTAAEKGELGEVFVIFSGAEDTELVASPHHEASS